MTPRTSYDQGAVDRPLLGETIGENFNRIAAAHAGREALVDLTTGRRWTYAELHRDVLALAHGLLRLGIGKGDRVGIWAPNCPEWTLLQYATAEIGAILVPINPPGAALAGRPDQHPVHVGNHRAPQGRDALAPQHLEQRLPDR
jgi:fatty-acyl-CoA synthase